MAVDLDADIGCLRLPVELRISDIEEIASADNLL